MTEFLGILPSFARVPTAHAPLPGHAGREPAGHMAGGGPAPCWAEQLSTGHPTPGLYRLQRLPSQPWEEGTHVAEGFNVGTRHQALDRNQQRVGLSFGDLR